MSSKRSAVLNHSVHVKPYICSTPNSRKRSSDPYQIFRIDSDGAILSEPCQLSRAHACAAATRPKKILPAIRARCAVGDLWRRAKWWKGLWALLLPLTKPYPRAATVFIYELDTSLRHYFCNYGKAFRVSSVPIHLYVRNRVPVQSSCSRKVANRPVQRGAPHRRH